MAGNLTEAVVATERHFSASLDDNLTANNGLLNRLKSKGGIDTFPSGRTICEGLIYGSNSSASWFTGYDTFTPPTTSDVADAAEYNIKQLGGFISISRLEEVQNAEPDRRYALVKTRYTQLQAQLDNTLSTGLYAVGTGSGGKELGGLQLLVADDPTAAGSPGGINQVTYTWWRNKISAASAVSSSTVKAKFNGLWVQLIRGKDRPDLIVCDDDFYIAYLESLQQGMQFMSPKEADAGFLSLKYMSADVVLDAACPNKRAYFLNTDHLFIKKSKGNLFKSGEMRQVANADYQVMPWFFDGNMTCSNRSLQGVAIAS